MAASRIAWQTIAELREFAGFTAEERFFLERSLDPVRDHRDGQRPAMTVSLTRTQAARYRELCALRGSIRADQPIAAIDGFFSVLVRVSAQDLARGMLSSFAAYRFLYERLLGAAVRPYLPSSFCAAAALPQIEPERRKLLLASLSQAVVATPCWTDREPVFVPCRVEVEPELGQ